jgi:hypothetical protein
MQTGPMHSRMSSEEISSILVSGPAFYVRPSAYVFRAQVYWVFDVREASNPISISDDRGGEASESNECCAAPASVPIAWCATLSTWASHACYGRGARL